MAAVAFKDYYTTLGVGRDADEKAIRTAYRKLAREHHPDLNPGDRSAEERFKEINEAYEVLSDADKRKLYNRFGEDWQRYKEAGFTGDEPVDQPGSRGGGRVDPNDFGAWFRGQQGGEQSWSYSGDLGGEDGDFSDFFQTMFGSRGRSAGGRTQSRQPRPQRGQDLEAPVTVSFDEAFKGTMRQLHLNAPERCPVCDGTGFVRDAVCATCQGAGYTDKGKTLEVSIPAGVATGSKVRMAGQGGAGSYGGPNGDVYLVVTVTPDPRFERDGDDLRTTISVPMTTAILGGESVVPTPTGRVALTIPAETQPGKVIRLRGQGMPKLKAKGQRGDLLAKVEVTLPTNISARERELLSELQAIRDGGAA